MRFRSAHFSLVLHAAVVFALIHLSAVQKLPRQFTSVDLISTKLVFHPEPRPAGPQGGGGARQDTPPKLGRPPAASTRPFVPPTTRPSDHGPALPMAPAVLGPRDTAPVPFAQLGDPAGIPGPPSDGPGRGPGIGRGSGRYGVGDGNDDGGVSTGGATLVDTRPALLFKVEPEFSDEARKARLQGVVALWAEVDESGRAVNIRVRQGLGLGLDEKAIEAVKKWRFRPATRNGKAVRAPAFIEVSFHLL